MTVVCLLCRSPHERWAWPFLMGCIQSGTPLNIVRLTYIGDIPSVRVIHDSEIREMMHNPYLRSTGVLNGLFHNNVIIGEADTDRAFYQEINERLLEHENFTGIDDSLFINAHNHQSIWMIVKTLRSFGIATAAIVDLDVIQNGGAEWTRLANAVGIPSGFGENLNNQRMSICQKIKAELQDSSNRKPIQKLKSEGGISLLSEELRKLVEDFIDRMAQYGVFFVPVGEVEGWMKSINIEGHASDWLIKIFAQMGSDPNHADYIHPEKNDVWYFMEKIRQWLSNPERDGMVILND